MFHSEYYAARMAAIDAEIKRNQRVASLIFSEYKPLQRRDRRAIKRLEALRAQFGRLAGSRGPGSLAARHPIDAPLHAKPTEFSGGSSRNPSRKTAFNASRKPSRKTPV